MIYLLIFLCILDLFLRDSIQLKSRNKYKLMNDRVGLFLQNTTESLPSVHIKDGYLFFEGKHKQKNTWYRINHQSITWQQTNDLIKWINCKEERPRYVSSGNLQGFQSADGTPFQIEIQIITLNQIKQNQLLASRQNTSLVDLLKFKKIKVKLYKNQKIGHLHALIKKLLFNPQTQIRIYAYDSTLFKISSFSRMIESYFRKQYAQNPVNEDQLRFYHQQKIENQISQNHLLQFFPGKILTSQDIIDVKAKNIQKLILEVRDDEWIFPEQPSFSIAKSCKFCLFKMQLYINLACKRCNYTFYFCSKICHYQFLIYHSCPQSKDQIVQVYGEEYLGQGSQKTAFKSNKTNNSDIILIDKQSAVEYIKSDSNNKSILKNAKKTKNANPSQVSLGGGMNNLGNTCYLNSSLQILIRTSLTQLIVSIEKEIKKKKKYRLTRAYITLISQLRDLNPSQSLNNDQMMRFKEVIDVKYPQFQGYEQHDAHQFIMFFLDGLSQQLNLNKEISKQINSEIKTGKLQDQPLGRKQWLKLVSKNNSPIINFFHGQTKTQIDCPHCRTTTKKFDSFSILSISIPEKNQSFTLDLFFESYLFREKIKYVKLDFVGSTVQDLIKSVLVRLGIPQAKSDVSSAYLIGYQGSCPEINKNKRVSELITEMGKFGQKQNQLFIFQMPNSSPSVFFFRFIYQSMIFTFKKPLFFTESKAKLRNFKIYNTVIQYLIRVASHYIAQKDKLQDLKKKMELNPLNYFKIKILLKDGSQQKGQAKEIQILPNTQNEKDLLQRCELQVVIKKFDALSQNDGKFFNTILIKLNKFVKASQPSSKKKYNAPQKPHVLEYCLKQQFNRKQLLANGNEWLCSTCNQKRRVYQMTYLYKTNKYLFIQIKRFRQGSDGHLYKNNGKVKLPLELDLKQVLNNPTLPQAYYKNLTVQELNAYHLPKEVNIQECYQYKLVGLILHEGKLGSGHYTAWYKSKEWLQYNDLNVSKINIQKELKDPKTMEKVYILLYERAK